MGAGPVVIIIIKKPPQVVTDPKTGRTEVTFLPEDFQGIAYQPDLPENPEY